MYTHFVVTWEKLTDVIKNPLITTMKAQLQPHIATATPKKCNESAQPNLVVDLYEYEKEFQEQLQAAFNTAKLPQGQKDDCEQSPKGEFSFFLFFFYIHITLHSPNGMAGGKDYAEARRAEVGMSKGAAISSRQLPPRTCTR